jgi:hypothetical protein
MAIKALLLSALAALPAVQSQILDPNWKGQGHVYIVEGASYPWGPDDPSASTIGCLNANGKLTASNCAVFNANGQLLSPTSKTCGWTPRTGEGAQPSVLNCANPTYLPIYRYVSALLEVKTRERRERGKIKERLDTRSDTILEQFKRAHLSRLRCRVSWLVG